MDYHEIQRHEIQHLAFYFSHLVTSHIFDGRGTNNKFERPAIHFRIFPSSVKSPHVCSPTELLHSPGWRRIKWKLEKSQSKCFKLGETFPFKTKQLLSISSSFVRIFEHQFTCSSGRCQASLHKLTLSPSLLLKSIARITTVVSFRWILTGRCALTSLNKNTKSVIAPLNTKEWWWIKFDNTSNMKVLVDRANMRPMNARLRGPSRYK